MIHCSPVSNAAITLGWKFLTKMMMQDQNNLVDQIDVLIIDDHVLLSEVLAERLARDEEIYVEHTSRMETALDKIKERGRYKVILMDYNLPDVEGLEGFRAVNSANDGGVALFSGVAGSVIIEQLLAEGAAGYVPKTVSANTLRHAVKFIAAGETFVPADIILQLSGGQENDFDLKKREKQVLALLYEGLQNKEIARALAISEVIVKMDMKSICRKLNVRNRTQAIIKAQQCGLV